MTTKKDSTKKAAGEETAAAAAVSNWDKTIGSFAAAIGMSLDDVNTKLKGLVGDPSDAALALLLSEEDCPSSDIKASFDGVPKAQLNNAIRTILRKEKEAPVAAKAEGETSSGMMTLDVLPKELSEDNLLETLRTGGVLKVNASTVTMAIRAAIADRTGVFNIRKTLIDKMEAHAISLEVPAGEMFYKIHNELTRRKYGDIFAAISGASNFASETRIKDFLRKVNSDLWPRLYSFHEQIVGWVNSWQQGAANPAVMMATMTAMMSGGKGGITVPGMTPPETAGLRDAANSFIDMINQVFAATGTVAASALGYDAKVLMDILNNPELPAQIGAANKEQMLKMLSINVSADVSRLATNATRYALAIMEFPKVAAGNEEWTYITALFQLGSAIPWDQLRGTGKSGIGSDQL